MNIAVGQKVFVYPCRDWIRNKELKEAAITKVGRKYFEVGDYGRFEIETLRHNDSEYGPAYKLYESKEALEEEQLHDRLVQDWYRLYNTSAVKKLTLDQLRRIMAIAEETPNG